MTDKRIAIITDSGTDTPPDFVAAHDVRVAPLTVNYSDGSFRAGVDITTAEVCERFARETPTTSLPSPDDIRACFEQARADGYESAVFVAISSGLSATYSTACLVAEQIEDFPIAVIDTKSIGIAAGLVVMAASEMAESGVPFSEMADRLNALCKQTDVFFTCKELEHLRAGGRISEPVYRLGSLLNIKPVITCNREGKYVTARKSRGWEKSLDGMVNLAADCATKFPRAVVAICCSAAEDEFDRMEKLVRERIPNLDTLLRTEFSPALIVHTGPYVVGMGIRPAL